MIFKIIFNLKYHIILINQILNKTKINHKNFTLTFPKYPINKTIILQHLQSLFNTNNLIYLLITNKHHQNKKLHLHYFFQLKTTINLKNINKFNYLYQNKTYHPKIKKYKSIKN